MKVLSQIMTIGITLHYLLCFCSYRMGERWVIYGVLVGTPEGNKPLGRPRRRRKD